MLQGKYKFTEITCGFTQLKTKFYGFANGGGGGGHN